jgi:predicted amidohydrolase
MAAAVQMNSTEDVRHNLAEATRLVEQAVQSRARLVVLPEMFNCLGRFEKMVEQAESIPGPTSEALGALAAHLNITLAAGSICERVEGTGKAYNTSLLFDSRGNLIATYRKIHLFDCHLPGQVRYTESRFIEAGSEVVSSQTADACLGQATCYDLRFPELFRQLAQAGVEILLTPAAFTRATGQAHWEILLRARAVENQAFVVAANQCGRHEPDLVTHGHSAIVDPWGEILAVAGGDQPEVITAELKAERLAEVRSRLPALAHRRLRRSVC